MSTVTLTLMRQGFDAAKKDSADVAQSIDSLKRKEAELGAQLDKLNQKRREATQASRILAAQTKANVAADTAAGKAIAEEIKLYDRLESELKQVRAATAATAREQKALGTEMKSAGGIAGNLATSLKSAVAGYLSFQAAKAVLSSAVEAIVEAGDATSRLTAVLRTTGGVSGATFEGMVASAESLSRELGVDDEAVLDLMSTFARFEATDTAALFNRTTRAAIDLAAASAEAGETIESGFRNAAEALGKFASEPDEALAFLEKKLGRFTDAEEQLIIKTAKAGDEAGALALTLNIVERRVGGTAEALRDNMGGALRAVAVETENMQELLAAGLEPAVRDIAEAFIAWSQSGAGQEKIVRIGRQLAEVLTAAAAVAPKIGEALSDLDGERLVEVLNAAIALSSGLVTVTHWLDVIGHWTPSGILVGWLFDVAEGARDVAAALPEMMRGLDPRAAIGAGAAASAGTGGLTAAQRKAWDEAEAAADADHRRAVRRAEDDAHREAEAAKRSAAEAKRLQSAREGAHKTIADLEAEAAREQDLAIAARVSAEAYERKALAQKQDAAVAKAREAFAKAEVQLSARNVAAIRDWVAAAEDGRESAQRWLVIRKALASQPALPDPGPASAGGRGAWDEVIRRAERAPAALLGLARAASAALDEETAAIRRGTAAHQQFLELLDIEAQIRDQIGERTAENADLYDALAADLRVKITAQISAELDASFAAQLKESLITPREQLAAYLNKLKELSQAAADGTPALITAAEAEELRARAIAEHGAVILSDAAGVFGQLEQMFGGFFSYLARAAQTLQQAQQMQQGVSSLATSAGAGPGMASALGAVGAYVVIARAMYEEWKKSGERSWGRGYDFGASMVKSSGSDWHIAMEGQQRELSRQIQSVAEEFAKSIGGTIDSFASLEVRVRRDGKYFEAWVAGEMVGRFHSLDEAVKAALAGAFRNLETNIAGLSPLVQQGFDKLRSRLGEGQTLDEAQQFLEKLREIADLGIPPALAGLRDSIAHIADLRNALNQLDPTTDAVKLGFEELARAQDEVFDSFKNQMYGLDTSMSDALGNIIGLKRGFEDLGKSMQSDLQGKIALIQKQIEEMGSGPGLGASGGGGARREGEGLSIDDAQRDWQAKLDRLKTILGQYMAELDRIPTKLSEQELRIGVLSVFEDAMRRTGGYAKELAELERYRVEQEWGLIKLKLVELGAWQQWAGTWEALYGAALAAANAAGAPAPRPRGGSGGPSRSDQRRDLRQEVAQMEADAKGALHRTIFDLNAGIADLTERAKKAKLPAEELARAIELMREATQRAIRTQAEQYAGIGTDFTRQIQEVTDFFDELRDLGKKETGMPKWLVDLLEGKALDQLGLQLQQAIQQFTGLVDPMLAINMQAEQLRQNILAYGQAAGWTAEQIAAAMASVAGGVEAQRQAGINGLLDRLFGVLAASGQFEEERQAFERTKIEAEWALFEAQMRFFGAWNEAIAAMVAAARDIELAGIEAGQAIAAAIPEPPAINLPQIMIDAARRWQDVVQAFAASQRDLMTDESVSGLTQAQQLEAARARMNELVAQAQGGSAEALGQLSAAQREFLAEYQQSHGWVDPAAWAEAMLPAADLLANAQDLEQLAIQQAMEAALHPQTDAVTDAIYAGAQQVADAIYASIAGVPGYAAGGYVDHPHLALVGEHGPELILPVAPGYRYRSDDLRNPATVSRGSYRGSATEQRAIREMAGEMSKQRRAAETMARQLNRISTNTGAMAAGSIGGRVGFYRRRG